MNDKSNSQGAGEAGMSGSGPLSRHNWEYAHLYYIDRESFWKYI